MPAKILQKRNFNGKQIWFLSGRFFTHTGVKFEIVGSEITGPDIYDVKHTVKNTITGAYASILMSSLLPILMECED